MQERWNDNMKVVIVGGVAGGATAAARIRRLNEQAEIVVFERSGYISYANYAFLFVVFFVRQGHQIAAQRHVVIFQVDPDTGGLQRGTAGIINSGIISHNGKVCHIAAGGDTVGNSFH